MIFIFGDLFTVGWSFLTAFKWWDGGSQQFPNSELSRLLGQQPWSLWAFAAHCVASFQSFGFQPLLLSNNSETKIRITINFCHISTSLVMSHFCADRTLWQLGQVVHPLLSFDPVRIEAVENSGAVKVQGLGKLRSNWAKPAVLPPICFGNFLGLCKKKVGKERKKVFGPRPFLARCLHGRLWTWQGSCLARWERSKVLKFFDGYGLTRSIMFKHGIFFGRHCHSPGQAEISLGLSTFWHLQVLGGTRGPPLSGQHLAPFRRSFGFYIGSRQEFNVLSVFKSPMAIIGSDKACQALFSSKWGQCGMPIVEPAGE